jgi:class 3 adenylate cyclase
MFREEDLTLESRHSPGAGEILVSQTVRDLVAGSGLSFNERGKHRLKGVPDQWRLFEAVLD